MITKEVEFSVDFGNFTSVIVLPAICIAIDGKHDRSADEVID